jgi:citrate lyase subunit beta/citryl-CoA lyase
VASTAISYLFVPASRPERYPKALAAGAGSVIIDLEDAIALRDKDTSLQHLMDAFENGLSGPVHVRINSADSSWFERDIAALAALSPAARSRLTGVFLPKAEDPRALDRVRDVIGGELEIIALIESAVGIKRSGELAAVPGLTRFALGAADLSVDLDVEMSSATIDHAYAVLVIESRCAGLPGPIASPPFTITDPDEVERDAKRLRGLGATAQLSIHPAQIGPIHAGFLPTEAAVKWAQGILASTDSGAEQIDGHMVDKPVRDRAARIIAQGEMRA